MSRYTSSYISFLSRLKEVEILRSGASKKERADAVELRTEIDALCRGAVVLLSSHVEAYVKELGEIALQALVEKSFSRSDLSLRTFYHISKDVIDELKDTADHTSIAEKIFDFIQTDVSYWSREGPFLTSLPSERFNKGFSNPKFDKIKSYLNRFGYENFRKDFYSKLKADARPTENMLDHLVDIRNSIAHGDPSATKTPADLKEMIQIISKFCRTTDDVFGDWCRIHLCPIR